MGDWTFTCGDDSVTLPINPTDVSLQVVAKTEAMDIPGDFPFIMSLGKGPEVLDLSGWIYEAGSSAATLETNYISKLKSFVYKEVTITAPDSRYDGTWIMTEFRFQEIGGLVDAFSFTMRFVRGSDHIIM